jgi:hypothetical protein
LASKKDARNDSHVSKIFSEILRLNLINEVTSSGRSISISNRGNLPHEVDKIRAVHGGQLEAQGFHHLTSVGQIKKMDFETIDEVPKTIRAVEQRHDVLHKLKAHLPGEEVDKLRHEVGDDRICHHRSVIGDVSGSIHYHTNLVEFCQDPGNVSWV